MAKFTGEEKLAAVQRYLDGVESYASIGASIGTSDSVVRNWVMQYEHHGEEVLFNKSYTIYSAQFKPDVLNYMNDHGTSPNEPNEKWATDLTEFKFFWEKLYLSPMLDLFNGEIITYTIDSRPRYSLVSTMLKQAFEGLSDEDNLLIHSDQGRHYQMHQYQHALKEHTITQSMSRKGNCYDNAVMENFFGILKSEFLYIQEFESIEHFKKELAEFRLL